MLVIVVTPENEKLYRTCTQRNLKKVAKSIHSHFPNSDYPSLEGVIFNGLQKSLKELELNVPRK